MMSAYNYLLIGGTDTLANAMVNASLGKEDKLFTVGNPREAVSVLENSQPDAVLWEVDTLDEESVIACRNLRRHSQAPIVMLVSSSYKEPILRAYRLGADAHIAIPCDRREFDARVKAVLRRQPRKEKDE